MLHIRTLAPSIILSLTLLAPISGSSQELSANEEAIELDPVLVNANRIFQLGSESSGFNDVELNPASETQRQNHDLSETLDSDPRFSSFRRTQSYAAHPTTQGISLRNQAATATSRALVLLDGVPQNDPFGGWLYWHQYNTATIESANVSTNGAGTTWGNLGSGGLITLVSENSLPGSAAIDLSAGTAGLFNLNATTTQGLGDNYVLDFGLRKFQSDGFHTLAESQRGSVDEKSSSDGYALNARLRFQVAEDWKFQLATRLFEEDRSNGTPVSQNSTDALNLSLIAEKAIDNSSRLNIAIYHQDRAFANVFSAVEDDRNSERPALDQYDVPADATGAAVTYSKENDETSGYSVGVDYRATEGSVNESFRNLGAGFTRDRFAGGKQNIAGLFGRIYRGLSEKDQISATLRFDRIENLDAKRIELNTENDTVLVNDSYSNRSESEISTNINWSHTFSQSTNGNLALQTGFRAPTLNELYRPFRVRNDITESNPLLENENVLGIEYSVKHKVAESFDITAAVFHSQIENMIVNALLTTEAGFDPRFGFIPDGGSGSQRLNIDETSVSGIEIHTRWTPTASFSLDTNISYADTEVEKDRSLPQFNGKQFPLASPLRARVLAQWKASEKLLLWSKLSWDDATFDDLGNDLKIDDSLLVALGGSYQINESNSIGILVNNLFDEEIQSGLSNDGLLTIAAPREALVTWSWRH